MDTLLRPYYFIRYRLIQDGYREVTYALQRVFRGYDEKAKWSLCDHITELCIPILKEYRDEGAGYPDGTCKNHEEWKQKLQIMIDGFEAIQSMDTLFVKLLTREAYRKEYEELEKIAQKGLKCFAENFTALWD